MLGDASVQRGEGIEPAQQWYNRMIHERHAARVKSMLDERHGGEVMLI